MTQKLTNVSPIAFDKQGTLWLSQLDQARNSEVTLATYRDGNITPEADDFGNGLANAGAAFTLTSGVYVCTTLGLMELKPSATNKASFAIGKTLNLQGIAMVQSGALYSEKTGLLSLPATQGENGYATYLFKLGNE